MPLDIETLKQLRRTIHANPEVSGAERETSLRIYEFLKKCNPDEIITEVGGHGIIATWSSGKRGHGLLFRAELDALPIEEINTFEYKSKSKGVSHKCGHDGHSTILCGLAQYLSQNKIINGKVSLLFQPAEENGEGARAMLNDKKFTTINPDYVYALHNLPGYPLHKVVIKENTFTASVSSIIIHLKGKTAHAAEPENGLNPALAISEIIKESIMMENNKSDTDDMSVVTPVYMELGEKAYGISAGNASIHLTLRCWNDENLHLLEKSIECRAKNVADKHQLKVEFEYTQIFHANQNNASAVDIVRQVALAKGYAVEEKKYPFKWGEDFGLFTSRYKGCMFGLGSGENTPALHNPDYDFPDELIETGVNIFSGIINNMSSSQ